MPLGRQLLVPAGLVQAVDIDNEQPEGLSGFSVR